MDVRARTSHQSARVTTDFLRKHFSLQKVLFSPYSQSQYGFSEQTLFFQFFWFEPLQSKKRATIYVASVINLALSVRQRSAVIDHVQHQIRCASTSTRERSVYQLLKPLSLPSAQSPGMGKGGH